MMMMMMMLDFEKYSAKTRNKGDLEKKKNDTQI